MTDNLNQLTLEESLNGLKEKKFKAEDLRQSFLSQIKKVEPKVFSFINIIEDKPKEETIQGPLSGIYFAAKEVLSTKGIKTTASSQILSNYIPVYNATVVDRLLQKGAQIIGKTNCDAFAFGASTENSGFGITKNPWDTSRVAGGSSGGSAAAVAADECVFSLGTDTGGSIRQPSGFCNVTGLKPTYGACSRFGLLAMASSFDCPGPMAKNAKDCEIIFNFIKGKDEKDATSVDFPQDQNHQDNKLKIGIPKEYFGEGIEVSVSSLVMKAAKELEKKGHLLKEISLPHTKDAISVYYILVPSEISSNMARYDAVRFGKERSFLEDEVKRRIMLGTYSLSAGYFDQFYLKAAKVRRLFLLDFQKAFSEVDLILGPVSPTPPFKIGEFSADPLKMYLADILTAGANLAGIPGLALPCGFTNNNLPVGMQILGPHFSEKTIFSVAKEYQQSTDWHQKNV
jgi:aspartyl-tRNA(Asn)/glutamyl-tRNA(Gln) amidotransferase subunit A